VLHGALRLVRDRRRLRTGRLFLDLALPLFLGLLLFVVFPSPLFECILFFGPDRLAY
jgi:hypothetical protein